MQPAIHEHESVEVVREFWRLMASNDFFSVGADKLLTFDGGSSLLTNDVGKKLSVVEVNGIPIAKVEP